MNFLIQAVQCERIMYILTCGSVQFGTRLSGLSAFSLPRQAIDWVGTSHETGIYCVCVCVCEVDRSSVQMINILTGKASCMLCFSFPLPVGEKTVYGL